MNVLLIFPPGWMQFGPYLSLPLLKGFLARQGIAATVLDLNIEFYDWVLSRRVLAASGQRLAERERRGKVDLSPGEYARLCKALLTHDHLIERVEAAKQDIRTGERYIDTPTRQRAREDIAAALNVVGSSFDRFKLTLNQIIFGRCGLRPPDVLSFLDSDQNLMRLFFEDAVRPLLAENHYDLVGFSLPAWEQLVPALTIAAGIRRHFGPQVHICMGGNYITRLVGTWAAEAHPYSYLVDSFSVFEGENSLVQLVEAIAGGGGLGKVENLVYRDGDRLQRTAIGTVDLDKVPAPDFDGLPFRKYLVPDPVLPLFTSRSCPYKCSFCTIPYASSSFRGRSAAHVAEDMAALQAKHGSRLFTFVDETLTVPAMSELANELNTRSLDVRWYGETRFHPRIDRDLASRLFRAGCRKLQFGLESANQRVLNLMKKGVREDCIQPNLDACLSEGIAVHLFSFYGFPGETEAEARHTHAFSREAMRQSRQRYGNPYSSVGSGAFNLEIYSDVYYHPDRYGVSFDRARVEVEHQAFEIPYEVKSGITRMEVQKLIREFNNTDFFHEACEQTGRIWWRSLSDSETNEDEDFLLYCFGADKPDWEDPAPVSKPWKVLRRQPGQRAVRLSPGVRTRRLAADFLDARPGQPDGVVAFYDPSRDLAVTLPIAIGARVLDGLESGSVPRQPDAELHAALELLMRHDLVSVSGEGVSRTLAGRELGQHPDARLSFSPDVCILNSSRGIVLFNAVSQDVYEVNAAVAWIASLLQEGAACYGPFIDSVVEQEPAFTRDAVGAALAGLVEQHVLVATAG